MSGLIVGIPDDVALRCLARVPYYLHPKLELVSRSWKAAIHSAELFKARQEVGSCEDFLFVCAGDPDNICQLYDPVHNLWIDLPELPSKITLLRSYGAVFTSQKLFVLGGCSHIDPVTGDLVDVVTNEVWSFDIITRAWSMKAPMLVSRAIGACCVVDGKIIVAGGSISRKSSITKAEMYDPEMDVWTPLPDILCSEDPLICSCTGLMIGGKMHIVGRGNMPCMQVFDNLELKWRSVDYGWLDGQNAVVGESVYVLTPELIIFKQDGRGGQVVASASQFYERINTEMVGFKGELYVIGGVSFRNIFMDDEHDELLDVNVLKLSDERPTWYRVAPKTRNCILISGFLELRM